jgi:uncharacterized protein YecE (DUF72 family)
MHSIPPWWPDEPEVHVAVLVADKGCVFQAVRLLQTSIAWARQKGCRRWYLSSETDKEFKALAKRVGAMPKVTKFGIDFSDGR